MLLRGERSLNTLGKRMMKFHIFKMLKMMSLHRGDGMWRLTDAAGVVLRPHQTASQSTVVISRPLSEFLLFLLGDTHAPLSLSIYVFPSSTLVWKRLLKSQYFWWGTRQMAGDRFGIHVRPTTDISYFSYYLDKIRDRNHWREKEFISAHSVSPSHRERQKDGVEFPAVRPCDGRVLLAS